MQILCAFIGALAFSFVKLVHAFPSMISHISAFLNRNSMLVCEVLREIRQLKLPKFSIFPVHLNITHTANVGPCT